MCSASVGTEASVTLHLRDVSRDDSNQSSASSTTALAASHHYISNHGGAAGNASAAAATTTATAAATLDNALTIGYPDPEMLADVLGTLQTASLKNTNANGDNTKLNASKVNNTSDTIIHTSLNSSLKNRITISKRSSSNNVTNISNSSNGSGPKDYPKGSAAASSSATSVQTVSTSTNTGTTTVNKTNSYIKNCLIRSSSCSNTTNITSLAQIMSNSSTSSSSNSNNNNNNSNNSLNSLSNNNNNGTIGSTCNGTGSLIQQLNSVGSSNCNTPSNNSCSNSNFSSSSNDSCFSYSSNSSSGNSLARSITSLSHGTRKVPGPLATSPTTAQATTNTATSTTNNPPKILKKSRTKISAPSRHGPQQCQICNKIFGNASALAKHKLTHSDERKYVCVMCSKAFKRQDHLNGHMMTHRNKKPYECKAEGCGKSYCDARSLRRHTENHHAGIITPHQNQTLSAAATTNNNSNSNLSLSPATANGDASSPDGATCLGTYLSNGGTVVDAATGLALTEEELKALNVPLKTTGVTLLSPTSNSTSSTMSSTSSITSGAPAGATITLTDNSGNLEGDGLTREQLDLISKIMRQTKQTTAQVTVSSPTSSQSYKIDTNPQPQMSAGGGQVQTPRPRTWNMQLLNSSQNVAITVDEIPHDTGGGGSSQETPPVVTAKVKEEEIELDLNNAMNPNLFNLVKIDQKPVECNLCHRKFKNVPALNGHMRLHGGYFKKDPETKKNEKKENNGPPLQTASIGVRALIEEKIISKRSKDLNKGAFVVPAPPSNNSAQNNPTTHIRRSISDLDSFLNPKQSVSNSNGSQQQTQNSNQAMATTSTIKNATKTYIQVQDMNLPQSIEIYSTKQHQQQQQQQQQQQKTMTNIGVGTNTSSTTTSAVTSNSTKALAVNSSQASISVSTAAAATTINTTTTRSTSTDPKDSTLIELLKRGTRIAVTQKQTNPNVPLGGVSRQIITNKNNCSVIIPSEVQVVSTKGKLKKPLETEHLQIGNATNVTLADGTPLSLTIAQGTDSNSEVYTVTYTSDGSGLFGDSEVYNVGEAEMLLQTVDTMQLLSEAGEPLKANDTNSATSEHSEQFEIIDVKMENGNAGSIEQQTQQHQNSCQTTQTLPNFQHFHSKELIIQNSALSQNNLRAHSLNLPAGGGDLKHQQFASSLSSPLHSPLAYPTPPSSHENVTQTSPYIEDTHHFSDNQNIFFNESLLNSSGSSVHNEESDSDKILKLKSVLEDHSFDANIKVEDLLSGSGGPDTECDLREFAEANLSFLDEDQEFLNDSRNATSPLSESFFTSGIGSAEEVKEVLREVLTEDQINLNCESQQENIIDLYYLPGLSLQSQMMPNSEDPLLSSSPRDFGGQLKIINSMQQQQQQQQQQQIQHIPQQQQLQQQQQLLQQNLIFPQTPANPTTSQSQQPSHLKLALDSAPQVSTSEMNQLILNLPSNGLVTNPNATTTIHYNVQTIPPQVQNSQNPSSQTSQQHHHQHQQQTQQFMASSTTNNNPTNTSNHLNSLNEALMQPIIYATSGTTDKVEIKLEQNPDNNPSILLQQQQQQQTTNKLVKNQSSYHQPANSNVHSLQPLSNQTNSILKRRLKAGGHHSFVDSSSAGQPAYSKYQALSPYKSKLRKPSRTHYTPSPILNPERKGSGLYCNVLKQLGCSLLTFDNFDDFDDDPVGLVDFSDESKVNLGSAYQASIPALNERQNMDEMEETPTSDLMWNPDCQSDEKILMRFIDLSKSSAVPLGSHTEEVALKTLLEAQGNTATAVLSLLQKQSNSFQMKWSSQELECFLKGLERHGKEFSRISKELGTKSTGECVQMYYFWKKLCVDYKVTHLKTETPPQTNHHAADPKPYVCEIPDCSASFSSKAALHGHTRIHTYGRNLQSQHNNSNNNSNNNSSNSNNSQHASTSNNSTTNPNATASTQGSANHASNQHQHSNPLHSASGSVGASTGTTNQANGNHAGAAAAKDPNNANKDITEFPCKVCGKVFSKIKSRSAHMKTHRVTDNETSVQIANNQNQALQQQQHHNQQQQQQSIQP
ncbi:homeobox protein 5 isoform X2 [Stomoxys calcitrans]|nr:homeobox protein 5 isoform X2 [Stomoxys calcitrans]